jgi:hypothetical protein
MNPLFSSYSCRKDKLLMNNSQWFQDQLQAGADGFVWGAQQVPPARRNLRPPEALGEWTAARHIFHMAFYEQNIALPTMLQWLGKPLPSEGVAEVDAWGEGSADIESLLADFKQVRAEQIQLLAKFDDPAWNSTRETIWGPVTLQWVVSKTFQHTAEHTGDILGIALFWDSWL